MSEVRVQIAVRGFLRLQAPDSLCLAPGGWRGLFFEANQPVREADHSTLVLGVRMSGALRLGHL